MRKNLYLPDVIQGIRDQLDKADRQVRFEAQMGMTMIAVGQLVDLCEHLYQRVAELERVQNERAAEGE
jgi:hypothetical protein